jgi:hypothetical protein
LNRPFLYATNRNKIKVALGQGLKETSILNPLDSGLIPFDITGLLGPVLVSMYQKSHPSGDVGKESQPLIATE